MPKQLPSDPNWEQLKKQAKAILREKKKQSQSVLELVKKHHPRFQALALSEFNQHRFGLQDAQLVLARDYGFDTWVSLREFVQARSPAAADAESDFKLCGDAIRQNDFERLKGLLESGNFEGSELTRLLGIAATDMRGEQEAVRRKMAELLIDLGAEPACNEYFDNYGSILVGACEFNNPIGIRFLLERGADPNGDEEAETKYPQNNTPMRMLLGTYSRNGRENRREGVQALLDYGARVPSEVEPEFMSIYTGDVTRLSEWIDREPTIVHRQYPDMPWGNCPLRGGTLLHLAAEYNEIECVQLLIERGADVNARALSIEGMGGHTPLFHCTVSNGGGSFETFQYLVDKCDLEVRASFRFYSWATNQYEIFKDVTPLSFALANFPVAGKPKHPEHWKTREEEIALLRKHGAAEPSAKELLKIAREQSNQEAVDFYLNEHPD